MSYRLINSNALVMSCAEVNEMPCIYADLPNGLDGGFYDMTKNDNSRWFELFGTPEKAARTLAKIPCDGCCESCSLYGAGCDDYGDGQLDWLREERETE